MPTQFMMNSPDNKRSKKRMKTVPMFVEKNDQYEDVEVTDSDQESDSDPEPCSMPEAATTEEAQLPPEPEDMIIFRSSWCLDRLGSCRKATADVPTPLILRR